jgi:hypothetical protein
MLMHADMAGRSLPREVALAAGTEIRASTASFRVRHVVATDATPVAPAALHAAGQAASCWTRPPFPGGGEDSRDSSATPVSRHPRADRPPPPHLRRRAQPAGHHLEVALRNHPGNRTVGRSCRRDHLIRCCADGRRGDRHSPSSLVLADSPAVRSQPRLVHHYPAPSTRRLRRRTDLLQPRQDSRHPVDLSSSVRRTSPAVLPGRHHC